MLSRWKIRPIESRDDAAVAAIIRTVMPEYGAIGDGFAINDPEVDWMQRAYDERRGWMAYLKVHPILDPLRDEPRFQALVARMRL